MCCFTSYLSADPLEVVDIGDGSVPRPTFVNKNLKADYKAKVIELLKVSVDCFSWDYHDMLGFRRELVEYRLPIKSGFRPYKYLEGLTITCMTKARRRLIGYSKLGLLGHAGMLSGFPT